VTSKAKLATLHRSGSPGRESEFWHASPFARGRRAGGGAPRSRSRGSLACWGASDPERPAHNRVTQQEQHRPMVRKHCSGGESRIFAPYTPTSHLRFDVLAEDAPTPEGCQNSDSRGDQCIDTKGGCTSPR
jgi:hypothetical protein